MTAAPTTNISEAMRVAVGSELTRMVSFPVSESDIRKWAIAVYYPEEPPRRFWDAEAAAARATAASSHRRTSTPSRG